MAVVVEMTQLSPTMTEGVVVEKYKNEGDLIAPGDALAGVETDKAVMDLEAFDEGILLSWIIEPGQRLPVGSPLAVIGSSGEDISDLVKELKAKKIEPKAPEAEQEHQTVEKEPEKSNVTPASNTEPEKSKESTDESHPPDTRIKASPVAKKIAELKQIDLQQVQGSGPNGRIIKRDVESFTPQSKSQGRAKDSIVNLSMMRQTIARRLTDSKSHVPHFYLTRKIDVTRLIKVRAELNESLQVTENLNHPKKVSLNDFVVKACALSLQAHPDVNAQWNNDSLIIKGNVDIGVAVAVEEGLLTPILRNADQRSLFELSIATREIAEKARKRKLQPDDYSGGSFTISNLGMYNIDSFQAIINAPEAALLAVGNIVTEPRYDKSKESFMPREILTVTLSCDHRVIDGAKGAVFLQTLSELLENPLVLLS
ncbi:MAG: 2-oxo acid dehydrogenase subunit E2 [Leptospiraceae bacterium]|nr:2-oxo acid dehydrogenase subunit E2 [Leptospiraceae bacterium]